MTLYLEYLLPIGASSCTSAVRADSVAHNRDYSRGTRATHDMRNAIPSGWDHSSSDRHNTLEKCPTSL